MIHCISRMRLGILVGFPSASSKYSGSFKMLFPNAKRMNLKVSVSPISDLWKRCRMSPGHEQIGKKARPSRDSVLEVCSAEAS